MGKGCGVHAVLSQGGTPFREILHNGLLRTGLRLIEINGQFPVDQMIQVPESHA